MTDHSPDHAERAADVAHALLHSEGEQIVRDMATHVGDEVHGVLKRHGMMMRTTAGTIAMGVLASLQMLAETVEFARKSMDGDAADEEAIASAALCLFADEATQSLPALAAALRGRDAAGEALREHLSEQITHVEARIKDGQEMGAAVWRIALEDVVRETRAALRDDTVRGEGEK